MSFVWVADPVQGDKTQYAAKNVEVNLGVSDGVNVEVVSGLKAGQKVVVSGADYLKTGDTLTNGEARSPRPGAPAGADSMPGMPGMNHASSGGSMNSSRAGVTPNDATVEVSAKGFTPSSISFKADVPAKLTFIRKDTKNCATEVVLPDYGIKRSLPLNQPVTIEFTPKAGEMMFTCGMNMVSGKVVSR